MKKPRISSVVGRIPYRLAFAGGWIDQPFVSAVNEDGDREGKRLFCGEHGLEYVVLKRILGEGPATRTSTNLRGFQISPPHYTASWPAGIDRNDVLKGD